MNTNPTPHRARLLGFATLLVLSSALHGAEPKPATDPKTPPPPAPLPAATAGALASSPQGWQDLLDKSDLSDWQRAPYAANKPLGARDPWKFDAATGILLCDATGIHENLLYRTARRDGTFHVEFRYVGNPAKPNSGVYARTLPDASAWYQAQLAPSGLGMLFGQAPSDGPKPKRLSAGDRHPELMRPAGEWNELEIACRGSEMTLWINGRVACRAKDVTTPAGHVGLEAEGHPIEFRNLKFKPLP